MVKKRLVKKRGRPPLPAGRAKRYPISMRTTKELKERLEQASRGTGRSIAQEVEFRLEQYDATRAMFGREAIFRLMVVLAQVLTAVERRTGGRLEEDAQTWSECRHGIDEVLVLLTPYQSMYEVFFGETGREAAKEVIGYWQESLERKSAAQSESGKT
jgi:hypothetical protein